MNSGSKRIEWRLHSHRLEPPFIFDDYFIATFYLTGGCPRDSWIQGGGWDDVAKGAVIGGAFGGGIGALSGAVLGGVNAWAEGKDFWTGKQKMLEFSIEPLEPMPVSCSEANGVISDSKIATFKRNLTPYEKGEIGVRRAIAEFEADGGVVLKREVTVDVNGVRNRFDFVGEKDGVIHLFEVKMVVKHFQQKIKVSIYQN